MTDNSILTLAKGRTSIEVWSLGARLNAASWDGKTGLLDGASTVEEARGAKLNHGSVAGPVANRIAGGETQIDGETYRFERKNPEQGDALNSSSRSAASGVGDH